jgi:hypothetical protein
VIKRRRGGSPRLRRTAIAGLATAAFAGLLALPGTASAAEAPICGGSLELNDEIPGIEPPGGLSYKFNCNAQVVGYAIVSNRQVDYFSTEVQVLDATSGEATPEQFSCEGPFPSAGFGCRGTANFGNTVAGEFAIGRDPCQAAKNKADKFKVWLVATVVEYDSVTNKPFNAVTQPFRLRAPDCGKSASAKNKRHHRRAQRA